MKTICRTTVAAALLVLLAAAAAAAASTVVKIYAMDYRRASEAAPHIQALLSPEGRMSVDERTNSIIVNDTAAVHAKIRSLLGTIDVMAVQLRIEVTFTERSVLQNLGLDVDWRISDSNWSVGTVRGGDGLSVDVSGSQRTFSTARKQFLVLQDGESGSISVGSDIPQYQWYIEFGRRYGCIAGGTTYRQVRTGFQVTPKLMPGSGAVQVRIEPVVSYLGADARTVVFRELSTTVVVNPGEQMVIGGSSGQSESLVGRILGIDKTTGSGDWIMMLNVKVQE